MKIGKKNFDLKHQTYMMGILNITPDSFSDGGKYNDMDLALRRVEQMVQEGADIIDIGGESTRPGYTKITPEEEILRIVPIIEQVSSRFDVPISVDTYKSSVALAAIEAGAHMINDIWGLKYDEKLAEVIAKKKVPCCLMHNRTLQMEDADVVTPETCMNQVISDLEETIQIARTAGIPDSKIILDPGIGFGKSYEMNLWVLNRLEQMHCLGFPVLLGTSRKSVIGLSLNLPTEERLEGTIATTVIGVMKGCSIFRVHDVRENARAAKMTKMILDS